MKDYSAADIMTKIICAKTNTAVRDEILSEKEGDAFRMIRVIHHERFSYVRMTEIEKEQEALLAIMDVIRDFDPDKGRDFDGFLRWKIMGRLKERARFQRKYDGRTIQCGRPTLSVASTLLSGAILIYPCNCKSQERRL